MLRVMELIRCLSFWAGVLLLWIPVAADEPTLARLSFWVPPPRMAEFQGVYEAQIAPILRQHGLAESIEPGRATTDSVFSRMFVLPNPVELVHKGRTFQEDPAWQTALAELGSMFAASEPEGSIRHHFVLYTAPAGPGQAVPAGQGETVPPAAGRSPWYVFDSVSGFTGGNITTGIQDREGNLWFGTFNSGAIRFDGHHWTRFTTDSGLAGNQVDSIIQDRAGNLWFGTGHDGVSRFDGREWITLTRQEGLANNSIRAMLEDRKGNLWFAETGIGVSRYDGQNWTHFTPRDGLVSAYVLTIFEDRAGAIWFGTHAGVSRYDGQHWTSFTTPFTDANAPSLFEVTTVLQDQKGDLWFSMRGGVARYDSAHWTRFTTADGLAGNDVISLHQDREGDIWASCLGRGVSRFDGREWTTFTTRDGLVSSVVSCILEDAANHLWFGAYNGIGRYDGQIIATFAAKDGPGQNIVHNLLKDTEDRLWVVGSNGVSCFDGQNWRQFTTRDGLPSYHVAKVLQDREETLWFGTQFGGIIRYDGKTFTTFTTADGLVDNRIFAIAQDQEGNWWFGTPEGVSRYDGRRFATFTAADGLAAHSVSSILQDRTGNLWFGTGSALDPAWEGSGVSRYDGKTFTTFTTADGLAGNTVYAILEDRDGYLWFGTGQGVSRYDGKRWQTFTKREGLTDDQVISIYQDHARHLWFGTANGGVNRYDGQVFQRLTRLDGLSSNEVRAVAQDQEGAFWFASGTELTRFRPPPSIPPRVAIDAVVADRRFEGAAEVALSNRVGLIAIEFLGTSLNTLPGEMVYRYRLQGYDDNWHSTRARRVEYQDLPIGSYTFEVDVVDRDLNYSKEPATVEVTIHPPYSQIALVGGLGLALVGLVIASGYGIKRRGERDRSREELVREQQARLQAQEQLNKELEDELQTAHTLQMGLMPRESPRIAGFDLAGRCIPANHVGGDFFQYFQHDGKLSIALADVTGHAMEAAIPMVMFSGILENQMEQGGTPQDLFAHLNRSLHRTLKNRSLVCCSLAELDLSSRVLQLASAAFPYPYHFSASTCEIAELKIDAYPLGVRPDTRYAAIERQLAPGDYLVFCSDGIIEATDATGAQFGYERTAETIRSGCAEDLSAEALLQRVIAEVKTFSQGVPQGDDQTVVVLKVDDRRSA